MITRIWHGRTKNEDAEIYLQFLLTDGTKEFSGIPGNLSVRVWQTIEAHCCHFWVVTEWESFEAIKKFAGEKYWKAKYYPFDDGMLLEYEREVLHYQSFIIR